MAAPAAQFKGREDGVTATVTGRAYELPRSANFNLELEIPTGNVTSLTPL